MLKKSTNFIYPPELKNTIIVLLILDAPRQGIIRRPDSRSSKNVTFDAAPPAATILGEDGRQSEAGAALNAEQKE